MQELPHGIVRLTALEALNVSDNRLHAVPLTLGTMRALRDVALHGNAKLKSPPKEIVAKGAKSIKKWLSEQLRESGNECFFIIFYFFIFYFFLIFFSRTCLSYENYGVGKLWCWQDGAVPRAQRRARAGERAAPTEY